MEAAFYIAAAVAVASTLMMITRLNAIHALLYLTVSLLAVAVVFYLFGAPFVAALEIIIYAGAIMVLFVFAVMLLNLGDEAESPERATLAPRFWIGPALLALVLCAEVFYLIARPAGQIRPAEAVGPKAVGVALFGPYVIAVELASLLLMAGLVGAYHLGRREEKPEIEHGATLDQSRVAAGRDVVRAGADRSSRAT
jgi:NADH-quinone oxidoreductase subunit J